MKLSIITINYNNSEGLIHTLDSVAAQTCRDFEHVIVDGGSTDGSVDIIKDYENVNRSSVHPFTLTWNSEPDLGIYDAMNKGIKKANGEYVYFLNSGDCFASDNTVADVIAQMDGSAIIIGRVNKVVNGKIAEQTKLLTEEDMSLYQMYLHGINHQSAVIRRDTQIKYMYDDALKIGADWKFFVQAIVLGGAKIKFFDKTIANYDMSGVSSNIEKLRAERKLILRSLIPERIARDYLTIAPHYYEVVRLQWLLQHPLWYKLYRGMTTLGRKLIK